MREVSQKSGIWRLSLEQIEATVADHLGPGRVPGNRHDRCFSRQISMYLAKRVGDRSTTRIGRFCNGRHHTTVVHAIAKVERLQAADESIDALIEVITASLGPAVAERDTGPQAKAREVLIETIAARVFEAGTLGSASSTTRRST